MGSKATLKQLSEILGISISTVSRALKDHPDIADLTKQKVRELADMLQYEPNALAVQLRTNASSLIGVIVPEVSGFFYHSFISGLESEARSWGYSLMILQSNNSTETEASNLKICRFNRTAGILVALSTRTTDLKPFDRTRDAGTPIVFFDKVPDEADYPKVTISDSDAGFHAADAILRSGSKNVLALFGDPALSITRNRMKAFKEAFANHSPGTNLQITHAPSQADAERIAGSLKDMGAERPDTVFCMSDEILVGVMAALNGTDIDIPEELSILALSNGFFPTLFKPVISYVETSGESLGRKAFEILHRCMEGDPPSGETTVAARFVPGGSLRSGG
jgi:LacI family transcriptional regulator